MPTRLKKRYSILLSDEIAERFERVARRRNGAKSAIIEEMLDRRLNPERYPLIDEGILRRLDEISRNLGGLKSEVAVATEMVSLFVRYYLTVTPPLASSEQVSAQALGKERFRLFVTQIGRRIASDRRLVSVVMESMVRNDPDIFALPPDEGRNQARSQKGTEEPQSPDKLNGGSTIGSESEKRQGSVRLNPGKGEENVTLGNLS
jgi:predicted DNA-binding protein